MFDLDDLPLRKRLADAAQRVRATGIVCYQASHRTRIATLNAPVVTYAGSWGAERGLSGLCALPTRQFTDWLLDDAHREGEVARRPDTQDPDSIPVGPRLLARLGATTFRKCIRGPLTHPWLVVVFLNPQASSNNCDAVATDLARRLLRYWGRTHYGRAGARRSPPPPDDLSVEALLEPEPRHVRSAAHFDQYAREALASLVKVMCPPGTLALAGSLHLLCCGIDYATGSYPSTESVLDRLVEIPVGDPIARDAIRRSSQLRLVSHWDVGLWDDAVLHEFRDVDLASFRVGMEGTADEEGRCFVRHAAMLAETHYFSCIREAKEREGPTYPAIRDMRSVVRDEDRVSLVLPLRDMDADVVLGVINIETTEPGIQFPVHRIWIAQYLAQRFASRIREIRVHGARRFIRDHRHVAIAQGTSADSTRELIRRTCEKLGSLYEATTVELLEPVGLDCRHVDGWPQAGSQFISSEPAMRQLLRAAMFVSHPILLGPEQAGVLVHSATESGGPHEQSPDLAEVPDLEVVGFDVWETRHRGEGQESDNRRRAAVARAVRERTRSVEAAQRSPYILLYPIHLDYEAAAAGRGPPTQSPTARTQDGRFCAAMLALTSVRPWGVAMCLPGPAPRLLPLTEFADLIALVQRTRMQLVGAARGEISHTVDFRLIDGILAVMKNSFAPDVERTDQNYVDLALRYVKAALRSYLGRSEAIWLDVNDETLETVRTAAQAIAYAPSSPSQYHQTLCRVPDRCWPLWVALFAVLYEAHAHGRVRPSPKIIKDPGVVRILVVNSTDEPCEKLKDELALQPRGKPGRGRHMAYALLKRAYTNVTVNTTIESKDDVATWNVAISILLPPPPTGESNHGHDGVDRGPGPAATSSLDR